MASGALSGLRVVELAGIGPAPFCGMVLADHGADVVRVERAGAGGGIIPDPSKDLLQRGKRSLALDLKRPEDRERLLVLLERADVLVEGFRPGVMERLGLGPDVVRARAPRLVYARMTGWGQDGPWASMAGHDLDYVALSGVLFGIGPADGKPSVPLNVVGDFGGGGLLLAFGILAALWERQRSGEGQVVDAAMVDGAALLSTFLHGFRAMGFWRDARGVNMLDGGAHFYDTYETKDGGHLAVAPIEPQFYAAFLARLGDADAPPAESQLEMDGWPAAKARIAAILRTRTRDEWMAVFEGTDACVAPVLSMAEAPAHPHNAARGSFLVVDGVVQPAPAPRFSRSATPTPTPPADVGSTALDTLLADWTPNR